MRPKLLFIPGIHGLWSPKNGGQIECPRNLDRLSESFEVDIYSDKYVESPWRANIISIENNICHKATSTAPAFAAPRDSIAHGWVTEWPKGANSHQSSPGRNITLDAHPMAGTHHISIDASSLTPYPSVAFSSHESDPTRNAGSSHTTWTMCSTLKPYGAIGRRVARKKPRSFLTVIACTEQDLKTFRSLNADIQGIVWPNGCRLPNQSSDEIEKRFPRFRRSIELSSQHRSSDTLSSVRFIHCWIRSRP